MISAPNTEQGLFQYRGDGHKGPDRQLLKGGRYATRFPSSQMHCRVET